MPNIPSAIFEWLEWLNKSRGMKSVEVHYRGHGKGILYYKKLKYPPEVVPRDWIKHNDEFWILIACAAWPGPLSRCEKDVK